jgi:hypothetical protein
MTADSCLQSKYVPQKQLLMNMPVVKKHFDKTTVKLEASSFTGVTDSESIENGK